MIEKLNERITIEKSTVVTDQVGFLTTQRVDGKLILPEAVQLLQMAPQG